MGLKELKEEFDNDVKTILSSNFEVKFEDTPLVPNIESKGITYPNLDTKEIQTKKIKTCVLYIDIRKSTDLSLSSKPKTLTKLYASFMRIMVKSARYFNGHVRNIIGDRIMVVFDEENCFKNAVHTAFLLNSVAKYILNKHFKNNEITCGIGIDYGSMLVSKGGIVKNGNENSTYKSLVWMGTTANVASKLTDLAHKTVELKTIIKQEYLSVHHQLNEDDEDDYLVTEMTFEEFFTTEVRIRKDIELQESVVDESSFYTSFIPYYKVYFVRSKNINGIKKVSTPPILITESVYEGFKKTHPTGNSILRNGWIEQDKKLYPGYKVYGIDWIYTEIR